MNQLPRETSQNAPRAILAGALISLVLLIYAVGFVVIVFDGPLAPWRMELLVPVLLGVIVFALFSTFSGSLPGAQWSTQTVPTAVTAAAVADIAAGPAAADPAILVATAAAFVAAATSASGLALIVVGSRRLAKFARFIPYPVTGGFLAASGLFVALRGIDLARGQDLGAVPPWIAVVAGAALLLALTRRFEAILVIAAGAIACYLGFHAWLTLSGLSLADAEAAGLLLSGLAEIRPDAGILPPYRYAGADLAAVAAHWPAILTVAALSLLGTLMGVSGVEMITAERADLDREFRRTGIATLVSGALGGLVGHHSVTATHLTAQLLGRPSRLVGQVVAAAALAMLLGGWRLLLTIPAGLFAVILCYIGFDILYRWLVTARREMSGADFAIVLIILATAWVFGFVPAVAVGIVAASLLFTFAYSRVDSIRAVSTAAVRRSATERADRDTALIAARGGETLVIELQGFLFFGTAHGLLERSLAEIGRSPVTIRQLVLDFRRVSGIDVSTAFVVSRLGVLLAAQGVELILTDLSPQLRRQLDRAGGADASRTFASLSDALADVEDRILSEAHPGTAPEAIDRRLQAILSEAEAEGAIPPERRLRLPAGATLFRAGTPADALFVVESGRLAATISPDGKAGDVLARFLPGAVVGEIGLYAESTRTATLIAETDATVRRLDAGDLTRIEETAPDLAARLHATLAALLAKRLTRTTALVQAIDR